MYLVGVLRKLYVDLRTYCTWNAISNNSRYTAINTMAILTNNTAREHELPIVTTRRTSIFNK